MKTSYLSVKVCPVGRNIEMFTDGSDYRNGISMEIAVWRIILEIALILVCCMLKPLTYVGHRNNCVNTIQWTRNFHGCICLWEAIWQYKPVLCCCFYLSRHDEVAKARLSSSFLAAATTASNINVKVSCCCTFLNKY